jgi:hypothetical protein
VEIGRTTRSTVTKDKHVAIASRLALKRQKAYSAQWHDELCIVAALAI